MDDTRWEELNPTEPGLVEARLLLQQAVQLVAAVGQSLGERDADDSQQSLSLAGGGTWHLEGWVGAELPLERLAHDAGAQRSQLLSFFQSARSAARALGGA